MKKTFYVLLLLPGFLMAQVKSKTAKPATIKKTAVKKTEVQIPAGTYLITGNVTGYADGTVVDLMNGFNGAPEASATVTKGKFTFSGKVPNPDLKVIAFNKQAPYITMYLDNSNVRITAKKDSLEKAVIKGSPAHDQYTVFNRISLPYQHMFLQNAEIDPVLATKGAEAIEGFVFAYPASHVSPLAILRHSQLVTNPEKMELMFNSLHPDVRLTPISQYIAQQITDAKKNPIGQVLPDFTQADTSGKDLTLSSLKGKYVLVDFWASWCGPCRQENPNVVSAYHKYKDRNFIVLGVSLDKSKKPWIDAIQMDNLTWPHVSDLKGWQNAVAQQYQINSIPQNFLLDPAGKVIAKNLRGAALDQKLESLLR